MRPRNLSARVGLIFCVVILSVVSIDFTGKAVAIQAGLLAYCASSPALEGSCIFPGSSEAVRECVVEKFHALLTAKPYPSQSQELLDQAIRACR